MTYFGTPKPDLKRPVVDPEKIKEKAKRKGSGVGSAEVLTKRQKIDENEVECQPDEAYGRLCLLMDLRLINIHLLGDDVPVQNLAQVHEYCKNVYGKAFSERDIIDAVGRLDSEDRQQLHSRLHDHSWYYSSRFILINNKLS